MSAELRARAEKLRDAHHWRSSTGRPWSPRVKSDACALCGHTPDVHLPDNQRSGYIALTGPDLLALLDERDAAIRRAEEAEQRAFEAEEALWDAGGDVTRDALIRALHEVSPDSHKRRNCRERHDIRADAILTAMGLDPHGKFRTRYAALRSQEDAGVPQEKRTDG